MGKYKHDVKIDLSFLILINLFYCGIKFIDIWIFPYWYLNIIYFFVTIIILINILRICYGFLSKLLGKKNKTVRLRYLFITIILFGGISSVIEQYFKNH